MCDQRCVTTPNLLCRSPTPPSCPASTAWSSRPGRSSRAISPAGTAARGTASPSSSPQHREYAPGDDIKHIDWKVFGRTERFHLKQYEQETNLVAWLLVDASESMGYGSGARTKYDLACSAAAAMAYLVLNQTDSVGVATLAGGVRSFLRPSGQITQLREACRVDGRRAVPRRRRHAGPAS